MLPNTLPDKLATPADYKLYFENIAYSNKAIQHTDQVKKFFTHPDQITGTGLKYPLMCAYPLPMDYRNQRDSMFECFGFEIWILKPVGGMDPKLIPALVNECKEIADDIIGKLDEDSKPKFDGNPWPFTYFDFNDIECSAIDDPMFPDRLVGWSMRILPGNQKKFIYDPSKWL